MDQPKGNLINYYLQVGKVILIGNSPKVRFNLLVGVAKTEIIEPTDWKYLDNTWIEENYSYTYKASSVFSIILNPKMELPLGRFIGVQFSPLLILNTKRCYAGVGFGIMLGKLRRKIIQQEKLKYPE